MKRSKKISYGIEASNALAQGIRKVADAVKVTLGPKGRLVLLSKEYGPSTLTKDGVSVAREIVLEDAFENEGAKLCIEVASKCNTVAGDGTTTATILAQALVDEGLKSVAVGGNPVAVKRGIDKGVQAVLDYLSTIKKDIKSSGEVEFVATISGNDPDVGKTVSSAFDKVGTDGVVTFEESRTSTSTTLDLVEGLRIDRGFLNEYFAFDPIKMRTELEEPVILFWGDRITDMQEIANFFNNVLPEAGNRPILVMADDVADNALATILLNNAKGVIKCICVKSPGFGDRKNSLMSDMAVLTGGFYFDPKLGRKLSTVKFNELGSAGRVVITRDDTTFVSGKGDRDKIDAHIESLKAQIENSDSQYDKEKLTERVAKLTGGVAVIRIGAPTETELFELKHRYEDAINATKAALEEGIVPGGGIALLQAERKIRPVNVTEEELPGWEALIKALRYPLRTIAGNAGFNGDLVVEKVLHSRREGLGFNAKSGKYENLVEAGVIDPVKVTRSALEFAASIAGMVLTTETLVVNNPEDDKKPSQMPMY